MTSSRAALKKPITRSGSRETAFSVENPYKPGFLDPSTPESFKMSVDSEFSAISNAFYQSAEVTSNMPSDEDLEGIQEELDILAQEITRVEAETEAGFASIQEELVILGDTDTLLAQQITDLQVSTDAGFASVSDELTVLSDADTVMAQRITDLEVETDQGFASIEEDMSVISDDIAGLEAKWSITADVNGKISGIELTNDGIYSEFIVMADRFAVTDGTDTSEPPFEVVNGSTRIKSAYVNTIQSDNWDGGSNGWFISNDGNANFQDVTIRGNVIADTFTGVGASGKYLSAPVPPNGGGPVNTFHVHNTTGKELLITGSMPSITCTGTTNLELQFRTNAGSGGASFIPGSSYFWFPGDIGVANPHDFKTTHQLYCYGYIPNGWEGDIEVCVWDLTYPTGAIHNIVWHPYVYISFMTAE